MLHAIGLAQTVAGAGSLVACSAIALNLSRVRPMESRRAVPAALAANTYKLQGRISAPVVVFAALETNFRGYVGMDLHSPDAPQIVWYYSNAPSNASGTLQSDTVNAIIQERNGNFLFADAGSGPPPLASRYVLPRNYARWKDRRGESFCLRSNPASFTEPTGVGLGPGQR